MNCSIVRDGVAGMVGVIGELNRNEIGCRVPDYTGTETEFMSPWFNFFLMTYRLYYNFHGDLVIYYLNDLEITIRY